MQQAEEFKKHLEEQNLTCNLLMHDRDSKFLKSFNAKFANTVSSVKIAEFRAPNTNEYVGAIHPVEQQECLDHFIAFGRKHVDYLCKQYVEHYHTERPHQELSNDLVINPPDESNPFNLACKERLGGVLRSYSHMAA